MPWSGACFTWSERFKQHLYHWQSPLIVTVAFTFVDSLYPLIAGDL